MARRGARLTRYAAPVLYVIAGFTTGFTLMSSVPVVADDCSDSEVIHFSDLAQTVRDTDDGDDEENTWTFGGGYDFGRSLNCPDPEVRGELGNDDIGGGGFHDKIYGDTGADDLYGGNSALFGDRVEGGDGNDYIADHEGDDPELLAGGNGSDIIHGDDGDGFDNLAGGSQEDWCYSDPGDNETSCEH